MMPKKLVSMLMSMAVLLSGAASAGLNASKAYADEGSPEWWTTGPLKTVYRTSTLPPNPDKSMDLISAIGEFESAQIAVRSADPFEITGVEFSDLVSSGSPLAGTNLKYRFVEYEDADPVQPNPYNPDRAGNPLYPLSDMPDPLSNETSVQVAANSTQPIFITNYVPAGTAPGVYQGTVTVKTTLGDFAVPIRVEVANVEIPKTSESSFINYQWMMTNGFTWDGFSWDGSPQPKYDAGQYYYGVQPYSDEWFALMDEFAKVITEYRQNMVWVRTDLLLQETGTYLSEFVNGIPGDIDWSLFDRYMQVFIDKGIKNFANIHLIHALNHMPDAEKPNDSWNEKLPDALPQTDAFLTNYLTALYDHLKEKGWLEDNGFTWYQHIRDEPIANDHRNWWAYVARKIHQINALTGAPFKTMDADPDGILLAEGTKEYVDVMVPYTPTFYYKQDQYKAEQAAGKDLWVYTMEVNQPPWLNRFWTQPTLTGRLLFWNLSQGGIQGHLHWAWNAWFVGPWNGDSFIVYPDKKHKTVKSSLRYEAMRDGLEDLELLNKLKGTNPDLAKRIADSAVSPDDPRNYTLDPSYIQELHRYLVRAAAGEQVGDLPVPASPYAGQEMPLTYMTDSENGDILYAGAWYQKSRQYAYLGSVKTSSAAGDELTYEFAGKGIDVVVEKNEGSGKFSISIDGSEPVVVDAYEKVEYDYYTIYSNRNLPEGRHTVKIVNLDSKTLSFDAFRVHMYEGQQIYDATLKSLEVTGVPSFAFNGQTTDYQIMLPDSADTVTIKPALTDVDGTITINGEKLESGLSAIADIPVGKSKISIVATASDGETTKRYTLNFLKGRSNEAGINAARSYASITASAARSGEQGVTYGPEKMADGNYGTMYASLQGYNDSHPFPHEIVMTWNEPQAFNTIVMSTKSGLIQGINDVDVQISRDGSTWETVKQRVPIRWKSDKDDNVMESAYADIPPVSGVKKLRLQINDAYYKSWNMYAVYELELYDLPDNGEIDVRVTKDVALSGLTLVGLRKHTPIELPFDPAVTEYEVDLDMRMDKVGIRPYLKDGYGTVEINGVAVPVREQTVAKIPEGISTMTVKAVGSDGAFKEYKIVFRRVDNLAGKGSSISLDKEKAGYTDSKYLIDGDDTTVFRNGNYNSYGEFDFPHTVTLKWIKPISFNAFALTVSNGPVDHKPSVIALKVRKAPGDPWIQILHDNQTWTQNGDTVFWPLYDGLNPSATGGTYREQLPILAQQGITEMQIVIYDGRFYSSPYFYEINEIEIADIPTGGQIVIGEF